MSRPYTLMALSCILNLHLLQDVWHTMVLEGNLVSLDEIDEMVSSSLIAVVKF